MLILTRRIGETLMIGDDVSIVIKGLRGNQVQLAVCAPKEVQVHRLEVYNRIKREQGHIGLPIAARSVQHGKANALGGNRA